MNTIDIAFTIIIFFISINGYYNGFFHSLIGPAALILSIIASWICLQTTQNIGLTAAVSIFGPILLNILLTTIVVHIFHQKDKENFSFFNRIGGILVSCIWSASFGIIILIFLALAPLKPLGLQSINDMTQSSFIYTTIKPYMSFQLDSPLVTSSNKECALCDTLPEEMQDLVQNPSIRSLLSDPRIEQIQEDAELREAFLKQDIAAVMKHPLINKLREDPAFMLKALKAYITIQTEKP